MEFKIRKNTVYLDVKLKHDGTIIELGLHDEKERKALANILLDAASELLDGIEEQLKPGRCELCNDFDTVICCINGCHEKSAA